MSLLDKSRNSSFASSGLDDDGFHAGSSDMSIPTPEQIKLGANSILSHILKHERGSFREYFDDEELRMLCSKLLMEVQCLINPELSRTATSETLSIAILSTTLLTLIQWKLGLDLSDFDRMIGGEYCPFCISSNAKRELFQWTEMDVGWTI
jgi:hypothetical protein